MDWEPTRYNWIDLDREFYQDGAVPDPDCGRTAPGSLLHLHPVLRAAGGGAAVFGADGAELPVDNPQFFRLLAIPELLEAAVI